MCRFTHGNSPIEVCRLYAHITNNDTLEVLMGFPGTGFSAICSFCVNFFFFFSSLLLPPFFSLSSPFLLPSVIFLTILDVLQLFREFESREC